MSSLSLWVVLDVAFFCSIDLSYLNTFFSTKTAQQYTCELFLTSEADSAKWDASFDNRISYTTSIHDEIKEWVSNNIDRWTAEGEDWFKIEMIPDDFLPVEIFEAEGGAERRHRATYPSVWGVFGLGMNKYEPRQTTMNSVTDAATDLYVLSTYYQSDALIGQANALLAMMIVNIFVQLVSVVAQYGTSNSWTVVVREVIFCLLFLRPVVDAYRVGQDQEEADETTIFSPMVYMILNKSIELATEGIPGAVLQLYVWIVNKEEAGSFALLSIGISALTTGYTSAIIAFESDVGLEHRKSQPRFYG